MGDGALRSSRNPPLCYVIRYSVLCHSCNGLPWTQKLRSASAEKPVIKDPLLKSLYVVGQNIALHASPVAMNSTFLTSAIAAAYSTS